MRALFIIGGAVGLPVIVLIAITDLTALGIIRGDEFGPHAIIGLGLALAVGGGALGALLHLKIWDA